jgi:hypothetical protein
VTIHRAVSGLQDARPCAARTRRGAFRRTARAPRRLLREVQPSSGRRRVARERAIYNVSSRTDGADTCLPRNARFRSNGPDTDRSVSRFTSDGHGPTDSCRTGPSAVRGQSADCGQSADSRRNDGPARRF